MSLSKAQKMPWVKRDLLVQHAALSEQARDLAERYNHLTPISQLPAEILHTIFALLAHLHDGKIPSRFAEYLQVEEDARSPLEYSQEIRRVSQVCRAWRILALASPGLWNVTLDCSIPHIWGSELLRRSSSMPLSVLVDTDQVYKSWIAKYRLFVLDNLSRVERLLIFANRKGTLSELVFKKINTNATALKTLILTNGASDMLGGMSHENVFEDATEEELGFYDDDRFSKPFLPELPNGHPPNLHSLHTCGYMLPLDSSIYQKLTSLSIEDYQNKALTGTAWCQFLSGLENLNSVSLLDCIWDTEHKGLPSIHLPNLLSFRISGPSKSAGRFLTHIFKATTPALRELDVRIWRLMPKEQDFDRFMDALTNILSQHARAAERRTLFQMLTTDRVIMCDCPFKVAAEYNMLVRLSGNFGTVNGGGADSFHPTLRRLLSSDVVQKYVQPPHIVPPLLHQVLAALTTPFIHLPGIEITYTSKFNIFREFLRPSNGADIVAVFPLSLPHVKEIEVKAMPWDTAPSYLGFKRFIDWRRDAGVPLQTLRFTGNDKSRFADPFCEGLGKYETHVIFEDPPNRETGLDSDDSMEAYINGQSLDDSDWEDE